jgi:choline kinase
MSRLKTLVILAGGNGSRFGGPKQFTCFGHLQKTLMEYNVYDAIEYGFNHVVFITQASQQQQLKKEVIPRLPKSITVSIAIQANNKIPRLCRISPNRTKPLGTAHALWCAKEYIKGRFVVLNADDYYGQQAFAQLQEWTKQTQLKSTKHAYAMVAYLLENTLSEHGGVNRGLCKYSSKMLLENVIEVENIRQIPENKNMIISGDIAVTKESISITPGTLVSMNCWSFDHQIFPAIEKALIDTFTADANEKAECYLPDVVMNQLTSESIIVNILVSMDDWFGVTYAADTASVENKINQVISAYCFKSSLENKNHE